MTTHATEYRIADVARRTGFTTSTLRYYEEIGLLGAPARTEAGYRLYDEASVTRLRFIARAKQLGCTLDEIADLIEAWDGDRCAPVSTRLEALVEAKLSDTAQRITELTAFAGELRHAANAISSAPADGPCGDACACMSDAEDPGVGLPQIACTLDAGAMPQRLDDWLRILERVEARDDIEGGLRLTFPREADVAALAQLVRSEQGCCSFFSFSLTVDGRGVGLEVRAPEPARDIVSALFGATG